MSEKYLSDEEEAKPDKTQAEPMDVEPQPETMDTGWSEVQATIEPGKDGDQNPDEETQEKEEEVRAAEEKLEEEKPKKKKRELKPEHKKFFESAQIDDLKLPRKRKFEDETPPSAFFKALKPTTDRDSCPYLDQINRRILDFDNRKLCSVTMSGLNVYTCLVCGLYCSGRTKDTPAYEHSLKTGHKMFIHMTDCRIFCLPEDYEIKDTTLSDIKHNLAPQFTTKEIEEIDSKVQYSHALDGNDYLPGVLGLNNLTETCWCNCVTQCLLKVQPLRNFFIKKSNYAPSNSDLVNCFGELVRKYHNPRNFKIHISPHPFLASILVRSNRKYQVGVQSDPLEFLAFMLHALHEDLGGSRKKPSVVSNVFQGQIQFERTEIPGKNFNHKEFKRSPFMYLQLELPEMPLFKDGEEEKFIPQIALQEILSKFDGKTVEIMKDGSKRRMQIVKHPKYLILAFRRFKEGYFSIEKNTTIVNTVIRNLDLKPYMIKPEDHRNLLKGLSVPKLQQKLKKSGGNPTGLTNPQDLIDAIVTQKREKFRKLKAKYDLVANLCHIGDYKKGSNKAFVLNQANNQWYEMTDLFVQETIPQLVSVAESYLQIWRCRT